MKILIFTDHSTHSASNSFYLIANSLFLHPEVESVHIASRGMKENDAFFHGRSLNLQIKQMDGLLTFEGFHDWVSDGPLNFRNLDTFDFILLRLPRPIHDNFFSFLGQCFLERRIINRPTGIKVTGNKQYLLRFPEWTAPTRMLHNIHEIESFASEMPIVLKPLEDYGGRGLLRIDGDVVYTGNDSKISLEKFKDHYKETPQAYIGMKFLQNVRNGDKRIVVAGGEILACSLRIPAEDSWLCNIAQGGSAITSLPTERELAMVKDLTSALEKEGIFMYGLDTLENDKGQRVISEINTLSVGGIAPASELTGKDLGATYARLFVNYVKRLK